MRILSTLTVVSALAIGAAYAAPRNVGAFTEVDARAGTDVQVEVGPAFSVDVTGRDAERIITRIEEGRLIVEPVRGLRLRGLQANVRVRMPRGTAFSASSGADLVVTGVNGGAVELDSSSGADLSVSGTCASFEADASSGADIHAQNLRCDNGSVDASSGADARVYASGRLDVDASSGGGVTAYGNPGIGDIDLSSGGSLRRAN